MPEYGVRVKGNLFGCADLRNPRIGKKIEENLVIDGSLKFWNPGELKFFGFNPTDRAELGFVRIGVNTRIGFHQFDQKIGLFLAVEPFLDAARCKEVPVWS